MTTMQEGLEKAAAHFSKKKVLVTGGLGFIAGHLVDRLTEWGAEVTLLDARPEYDGDLEYIHGDVRDYDLMSGAVKGKDVVFHFASILGVERILQIPLDVMDVNLGGTVNALKACVEHGVDRMVLTSSSEIYGEPRVIPTPEDTLPSPVSVYGVSKLAAETYCQGYAQQHGLKYTAVRYFNVYGEGQAKEFVISKFLARFAESLPPIIFGTGEQVRTYTYVSDAIDCTLLAAASDKGINEVFNIGGAETISLIELARLIGEISGKPMEPEYREFGDTGVREKEREVFARIPSVAKARAVLGYRSKVGLREGLTRTYDWYLKNS
jgi:Nucleoside-diphosphate-sugar epimerases